MMSTEETWQCAHPASPPNKIYERTEPAYLRPHILTKPHWDQLHPPQDKAQRWDQSSEEDELPLHLHIVLLISRIDTRPGDIPPSEASEGVRRGRGKWDQRKSWSSHRSPWLQRMWLALFLCQVTGFCHSGKYSCATFTIHAFRKIKLINWD